MDGHFYIVDLLEKKTIKEILRKGSGSKPEIQELQTILYEMGFGKKLKWDVYHADGDYGRLTASAIKDLSKRNNIISNGDIVSEEIAGVIIKLYDILDEVQQLNSDIYNGNYKKRYRRGSKYKNEVAGLQTLLNAMGYGKELNWETYQNDGIYGKGTTKAVLQFAVHRKIKSKGEYLTKRMCKKIVSEFSKYYGRDWKITRKSLELSINNKPNQNRQPEEAPPMPTSALVTYSDTHFVGKKITCDVEFVPALKRINAYAAKHDIKILITSSFRTSIEVPGAIVTPARMSNHMAGHGIDMNIKYGPTYSKLCNSKCLGKRLPSQIAQFIEEIRNDPELRWGGDFRKSDPVHIDDHLNKDPEKWKKRYDAVQKARKLGLA
ncbi:M15 family metallopeptidase [Flexithrix dorotheae]|uniref:M15 family metallopeptidase n=1 Tax=Flexithrix dorotheae TaxID=70993 RepID=UPI000380E63C|nr:M15 family metallopeptidase [Flexithrix dorotheae]